MLVLPKPILGEITAFTIATPDLERSLTFYQQLGFSEVLRAEWPFLWIQVSDGVILIMLRKDADPYLALTYYVKNIDKVAKTLKQKGITFMQQPKAGDIVKRYVFQSPDGLNISLVSIMDGFKQPDGSSMLAMPQEDYFKPEKYVNKACGLYGEFAHPIADLEKSVVFWELLGFKVISKFTAPYPWAIMSDGLAVVGIHQSAHFDSPAITYFAADMPEKIEFLKKKGLAGFTDMGGGNIAVTTPEEQRIFLFQLGATAEPKKKRTIADIQQTILETERLLLKELSPDIMKELFASFPDGDIISFLGLSGSAELDAEKQNFKLGLTTYRTSFKNFLIAEKTSGRIVGKAGFHTWHFLHARAELGYNITDHADKQKGYMTEAISAIIAYGFGDMELNRIEALVGTNNEPSLRLLSRLGFTQEGIMRSHYFKNNKMEDSICFSLLRSEYLLQSDK